MAAAAVRRAGATEASGAAEATQTEEDRLRAMGAARWASALWAKAGLGRTGIVGGGVKRELGWGGGD
jgi:hypothetical protein